MTEIFYFGTNYAFKGILYSPTVQECVWFLFSLKCSVSMSVCVLVFIYVHTLSSNLPSVHLSPSDLVVMVLKAFWEGLITHTQEVRGGRGPLRVPCKRLVFLIKTHSF